MCLNTASRMIHSTVFMETEAASHITGVSQQGWGNCLTNSTTATVSTASHPPLWTSVWPPCSSALFLLPRGFIPRALVLSFENQETESKSYKWKLKLSQHWVTCSFLCLYVFSALFLSPTLTSNSPSPFLLIFMSSVLQPSSNIPNSILALLEKFSIFSGKSLYLSFFLKKCT